MKKNTSFKPSISAEREFVSSLRKIARVSGHLVEMHLSPLPFSQGNSFSLLDEKRMMDALKGYSEKLTPWAMRQSSKLLEQVMRSNKKAYQNKSKALGLALKMDVAEDKVGRTAAALMFEQVDLIKSIPIEAGLRAQKLALEAVYDGTRADEIAKELMRTTEVTESRAVLIARTETARATASVNQSRALSLGSRQYRWHNSGDGAVRESHRFYKGKRLQGMVFSWDDPPTLDDGMRGHPGTFPNCRCFAEGIFYDG